MLDILDVKGNLEKKKVEKSHTLFNFNLGFIKNPKNGRVKALSKACLDRTYINKKKLKIFHFSCIFLLIYDKLEKINKNLIKGGQLWKVDPVIPVVF